jgi:hypothetical protein
LFQTAQGGEVELLIGTYALRVTINTYSGTASLTVNTNIATVESITPNSVNPLVVQTIDIKLEENQLLTIDLNDDQLKLKLVIREYGNVNPDLLIGLPDEINLKIANRDPVQNIITIKF